MKYIRRFFRQIKEGFVGVGRHIGMAISSATAVTITLLLIGVFLVLTVNLNALTEEIEGSISLSVLLNYEVSDASQREAISSQIKKIDGVTNVEFRSKETEFDYYVSQYSDDEVIDFYNLYRDDNPFHDVFLVSVVNGELISNVKAKIELINGIDSVYDGGSNTYLLIDILDNVRYFGGILVLALILLAIYLIYNTIKITIDSRRNEIWIMRNVGAMNSYIRGPFLVEGIIIGIIGSILPIAGIIAGYYYLYEATGGVLLGVLQLLPLNPYIIYLSAALLIIGVIVGYIGSYISVCKFLRMRRWLKKSSHHF